MTKKVGVISIGLSGLMRKTGLDALEASGNNFGNMLFTSAAYEQVIGAEHIGFDFNPQKIKEQYEALFLPAANWINTVEDWGGLASRIEDTGLPCTAVGLGAQLNSLEDKSSVKEGTKRFLKVISNQSASIGVRGEFTANVLNALGVYNVEVLGCPSIFMFGKVQKLRDLSGLDRLSIGVGPTRYVMDGINSYNALNKQRQLYQYAIREADSIYYQSEQYEISKLARLSVSDEEDKLATKYYGLHSATELSTSLLGKGKYHTSVNSWLTDVSKNDVYIGTRIHGAIAATLAGTLPILITHDNRTSELAETMAVPSISISDFNVAMLFDIPALIEQLDFEKFNRRSELNIKKLKKFYNVNGIENNIKLPEM